VSSQGNVTQAQKDDLWGRRVDELGLRLEDSPFVWPLIQRLKVELLQAGITLEPRCYVANEWGCPDGQPLIGIPFYLLDPRFHPYEEEHADDLEDAERVMLGLRHEAGHAIAYAYKLYSDPEWRAIFGAYDQRYHDDYLPAPFSRQCVRHLPGWYAQKHPDEDFAETFAVWLTPGGDWRTRYRDWDALRKLDYVDRTMKRIGPTPPLVDPAGVVPDPEELSFTVAEFYLRRTAADQPPVSEIGDQLDHDLGEIFSASGIGTDVATLLTDRRRTIMRSVSGYTGARMYVVKALLDTLIERARVLDLRVSKLAEVEATIAITALVGTLTHNFLQTGQFVPQPAAAVALAPAPANDSAPNQATLSRPGEAA
jgi:putative zinc-binding metallo-peptidase